MEILSPAGNFEKLQYAIMYGADAVYAGSCDFSLRAKADNFDHDELLKAVDLCHKNGKKIYVPLNIYAHNRHIEKISEYLKELSKAKIDAVIVSDLGVLDLVKNITPEIPIHISTQANVTSYQSVKAFQKLGAKRIILARELTFTEIKEIREANPDIELEMFVHGAMCIAYSGRCLISAFLNNRSANLGECTQPCRWRYSLTEESRPNQSFAIDEDRHGFYFMNSKDLNLWDRLAEIYKSGIDSIKIEGRMKSLYYVAAVTRAYKQSILQIEKKERPDNFWKEELEKISHRIYTEAFFDDFNADNTQNYETSTYIRDWQFVGNIASELGVGSWELGVKLPASNSELPTQSGGAGSLIKVKSYHKIKNSDEIEIIFPDRNKDIVLKDLVLFDENKEKINETKPNSYFYIEIEQELPEYGIVRKKQR